MLIKIKVIKSKKNEWVGWFGDNLLKVRLNTNFNNTTKDLLAFLQKDLGIKPQNILSIKQTSKNLYELELPDISWELFISVVH